MLHYLGQIADLDMIRKVNMPRSRTLLTADKLHYRRLACAVLADKAYLVAFAYMEIYIVK